MALSLIDLDLLLKARAEGMGAFKEADDGLAGVTRAALAVGTVAATAVAGFAVESVHHAEEVGQAAFEMSEKFGLLPGKASQWLAAGKAVGVETESMSVGFKFLAKNMEGLNLVDAAKATKELAKEQQLAAKAQQTYAKDLASSSPKIREHAQAVLAAAEAAKEQARQNLANAEAAVPAQQAFDALGIKTKDAKGNLRDLNDVMLEAADAFAKMPDGAEKAGLAVKLFGRSGTDLIPVLNQGRAGLQGLMDAAVKSGAAMSSDQVEGAHQAYLAHKQFDAAIAGVTNQLGSGLLPTATRVFTWMTGTGIPATRAFFGEMVQRGAEAAAWAKKHWDMISAPVRLFYENFVPPLLGAFNQVRAKLTESNGLFQTLHDTVNNVVTSEAFAAFIAWMGVYLPRFVGIGVDAIITMIDYAAQLLNQVTTTVAVIADVLQGHFTQAWKDAQIGATKSIQLQMAANRDLGKSMSDLGDIASGKVAGDFNAMKNSVHDSMLNMVADTDTQMSQMQASMNAKAQAAADGVTQHMEAMQHKLVGGSIIPDMVTSVLSWFEQMSQKGQAHAQEMGAAVAGTLQPLAAGAGSGTATAGPQFGDRAELLLSDIRRFLENIEQMMRTDTASPGVGTLAATARTA